MARTKKRRQMSHTASLSWPAAAGNAVVESLGQALHWAVSSAARAPLASLVVTTLVVSFSWGSANALFWQPHLHPSPMFVETASIAAPVPAAHRPATHVTAPSVPEPAAAMPPVLAAPGPAARLNEPAVIGNRDVADLQSALVAMGLLKGKVDGYYGPKTAEAIRAFERTKGMKPVGLVTPELIAAVKAAEQVTAPQDAAAQTAYPAPGRPASSAQPLPPVIETAAAPVATPADDPIARIARLAADAPAPAETDSAADLVLKAETGLARLGFLHGEIDGVFDQATARAIREFENYKSYRVTGRLEPELIDLLREAGAFN